MGEGRARHGKIFVRQKKDRALGTEYSVQALPLVIGMYSAAMVE